jgi:hypothetical protein
MHRIVPESPRWLLTNNRLREAIIVFTRVASSNNKQLPDKYLSTSSVDQTADDSSQMEIKEVKKPKMMKKYILNNLFALIIIRLVFTKLFLVLQSPEST